jgi:hypothetical protein
VEIRPVFEADDFGEELTPELRERCHVPGPPLPPRARLRGRRVRPPP